MLATFPVEHVGHEQHVEVLIGLHECINEAHRFHRMHVLIDVTVLQKQMPSKPVRHGHIRLRGIVILDWVTLVKFVPSRLVEARIVIA